jgi:hypothetical protein
LHFIKIFMDVDHSLNCVSFERFEVISEALENDLQFIKPFPVVISFLNQFVNYVFVFSSFPGISPLIWFSEL